MVFSVPQAEHCTHFVVEALPLMRCCRVCRYSIVLTGSQDQPKIRDWLQALQVLFGAAVSDPWREAASLFVALMKDDTAGEVTTSASDAWSRNRRRASIAADAISNYRLEVFGPLHGSMIFFLSRYSLRKLRSCEHATRALSAWREKLHLYALLFPPVSSCKDVIANSYVCPLRSHNDTIQNQPWRRKSSSRKRMASAWQLKAADMARFTRFTPQSSKPARSKDGLESTF